nr:hypothetical protein [Tanacetum cinerariifolium]
MLIRFSEAVCSQYLVRDHQQSILEAASFCSSVVTRATNSESNVLCCGEGGGSERFIVVVVVVTIKTSDFVEDAGLGGERSMIGVHIGGIEEEV